MILFIDATVRDESRTRILAEYLVKKLDDEIKTVRLYEENLPKLDKAMLKKRNEWCESGDFSDSYFSYAKDFAKADTIVFAAPFWDLSFPAVLKQYLENICVTGLTFGYGEDGHPVGMCNGNKIYYVCTAGGPVFCPEYGFGYIESLARTHFGINECHDITIENLDIAGADIDKIMEDAFARIDQEV